MHGNGSPLTLAEKTHYAQRPKTNTIPKALGYIETMPDKTVKATAERTSVWLGYIDGRAFFRKFLALTIGGEISLNGSLSGVARVYLGSTKRKVLLSPFFVWDFSG
jgi:hypothetical protein